MVAPLVQKYKLPAWSETRLQTNRTNYFILRGRKERERHSSAQPTLNHVSGSCCLGRATLFFSSLRLKSSEELRRATGQIPAPRRGGSLVKPSNTGCQSEVLSSLLPFVPHIGDMHKGSLKALSTFFVRSDLCPESVKTKVLHAATRVSGRGVGAQGWAMQNRVCHTEMSIIHHTCFLPGCEQMKNTVENKYI